jgi:hypothetical protein
VFLTKIFVQIGREEAFERREFAGTYRRGFIVPIARSAARRRSSHRCTSE